jgi:hypothetical protein
MDTAPSEAQLHALEQEFGMSAREVLDVINSRNRCKIAVRGAIAEAHLIFYLRELLRRGAVDGFEDFDRDGYPDCRVDYHGQGYLLKCKNVRKSESSGPMAIDFQRTRNPIERKWERYYQPNEFDIVAACLWNRTGKWEFLFAATEDLPRHPQYPDRLATRVIVTPPSASLPTHATVWKPRLPEVLERLSIRH